MTISKLPKNLDFMPPTQAELEMQKLEDSHRPATNRPLVPMKTPASRTILKKIFHVTYEPISPIRTGFTLQIYDRSQYVTNATGMSYALYFRSKRWLWRIIRVRTYLSPRVLFDKPYRIPPPKTWATF